MRMDINMSTQPRSEQRGPSLWAILLILVGVVWLLAQANIISRESLSVLFRVWPILLIGIGLELLVGRQSRALSTIIILGTIAVLVVLMVVGPSIGLAASAEVTAAEYSEPLGDTESAEITIGAGVGNLNVRPLTDSSDLFSADIRYLGSIQYDASGSNGRAVIRLENETEGARFFNPIDLFGWLNDENSARWDIGISPNVPVNLNLSAGTGGADLDLGDLQLTGLSVNSGTGGVTLTMPAVLNDAEARPYDAVVSLGTGGATLTLEEGIAVNLRVNSGTGGVTIDVPDSAAVRVDAETGTGGINTASFLTRTSGDDDNFVGDSGIWESDSYASADTNSRITIEFDGGTGGLTVR